MNLKSDYEELFRRGYFLGYTLLNFQETIQNVLDFHQVNTILDYGCGKAEPYKNGKAPWADKTKLYDPFVAEYSTLPDGPFDAVICSDVLEHVPEDKVSQVLSEILDRATKCVFITFCNRPAKKELPITGGNVHITQRPKQWWEEKIAKHNHKNVTVYLFETE